jgi:hypothetical protein
MTHFLPLHLFKVEEKVGVLTCSFSIGICFSCIITASKYRNYSYGYDQNRDFSHHAVVLMSNHSSKITNPITIIHSLIIIIGCFIMNIHSFRNEQIDDFTHRLVNYKNSMKPKLKL